MKESKFKLERRVFDADICDMKKSIPGFEKALNDGGEFTVALKDLVDIAPRTTPQVRSYNRLVTFLKEGFGLTLKIISQKTKV